MDQGQGGALGVPVPHGGGEWMRWTLNLLIAGLVSYLIAISTIRQEVAVIKATQESQFSEVLRRLDVMQSDIRELRHEGVR